jgi:REP element-mobilizing transposase RayT
MPSGTPYDRSLPAVSYYARQKLRGPPILLNQLHADAIVMQLLAHAAFREHALQAAALMANHCHIVVGVPGDPAPSRLLGDYKSYLSRNLNVRFSRPIGGTWWTESGSKRKLPPSAVQPAVEYVRRQHRPLSVWIADHWQVD